MESESSFVTITLVCSLFQQYSEYLMRFSAVYNMIDSCVIYLCIEKVVNCETQGMNNKTASVIDNGSAWHDKVNEMDSDNHYNVVNVMIMQSLSL